MKVTVEYFTDSWKSIFSLQVYSSLCFPIYFLLCCKPIIMHFLLHRVWYHLRRLKGTVLRLCKWCFIVCESCRSVGWRLLKCDCTRTRCTMPALCILVTVCHILQNSFAFAKWVFFPVRHENCPIHSTFFRATENQCAVPLGYVNLHDPCACRHLPPVWVFLWPAR